ncbi:MAG: hypothetical protein NZT61_02740 [Deltaproteobacteria bacterium]|nr:hypothetical protein [Deltaproteobacteria bacterium]MCX7952710.1 hypothetical protein [Deltaproteobacteria bacterium]
MTKGTVALEFALVFVTVGLFCFLWLLDTLMLMWWSSIGSEFGERVNQVMIFTEVESLAQIENTARNLFRDISGLGQCSRNQTSSCFTLTSTQFNNDQNFLGQLNLNLRLRSITKGNYTISKQVLVPRAQNRDQQRFQIRFNFN